MKTIEQVWEDKGLSSKEWDFGKDKNTICTEENLRRHLVNLHLCIRSNAADLSLFKNETKHLFAEASVLIIQKFPQLAMITMMSFADAYVSGLLN